MAQEEKKAPRPMECDETNVVSSYANVCRVTGSPEELIVDFGLNSQPMNANDKPIEINQRIILNFYTAKRLLHALHVSVRRHEDVFGAIETDISKRMKNPQDAKSEEVASTS
jgi:hypothetical protein